MLSLTEWAVLLGAVAAIVYWLDGQRAHEQARATGRQACQEAGVQLLDDTVELVQVRLRRDPRGRLAWWRAYRFEFSAGDDRRHRGRLTLHGRRLLHCTLGT